jgi:hypothetical protein
VGFFTRTRLPGQIVGRLELRDEVTLFTPGELVSEAVQLRNEVLAESHPLEHFHGEIARGTSLGHDDVIDVELYSEDFFGSVDEPSVRHEANRFSASFEDGAVRMATDGDAPVMAELVGDEPVFTDGKFLFDPDQLPEQPDSGGGPIQPPKEPKEAAAPPAFPQVIALSETEKVSGETAGERERRLEREERERGKAP